MRPSTGGAKRAGGRYVLGDLLGRGGMAEVFAGYSIGDHGFQKPVAIKRLLPELACDHVFVERLIQEAKLLVGMQHGNIVSVLDLARDGDDVFLVMEFVDGPSLRQLLKSRGDRGLSLGTTTHIVQTAATGLEFAHSRPGGAIIHADISPSNLLLTTSGEVRVADFGIARREGGGYGIVEGKWAYMAPEQARGEPLTPRSDVFALGVVLYELITGNHPFGRQVTHEERDSEPMRVIPPRVVRPSIPHGLDAICMRALAHDPRDRYARMQQLIDAIVEERFTNQWREGASDLAQAIREVSPQPVVAQPRTQVTDRPVTIITRSLIELTPPRRASSPRVSYAQSSSFGQSQSRSPRGTPPPVPSGGEIMTDEERRAAALLEIPPMLRAGGTPMPPFQIGNGQIQTPELDSVVGGNTMTGALPAGAMPRSNARLAIAILGVAALAGAIAAVVITSSPGESQPRPAPPAVVQPAPPAVVQPAPSITEELREAIAPPAAQEEAQPEPLQTPTIEEEVKLDEAAALDAQKVDETSGEEEPAPAAEIEKVTDKKTRAPRPRARRDAPKADGPPGYLRVGHNAYTLVTVAGHGTRDAAEPRGFPLPPGKYTVRLKNGNTGQTRTQTVVIETSKTKKIFVEWEDDE